VIKYPRNASHRDRAETRLLGLISLLGGGGLIFSPRNVEGVGRFNRGRNGAIIKKKEKEQIFKWIVPSCRTPLQVEARMQ